jgi:hypothetical protein
LLPLYVRNIEEGADEHRYQQCATCHNKTHVTIPLNWVFAPLAPAKSSRGQTALNSPRRRRWQRCRLLRRGRCRLNMTGRRCGDGIGKGGLHHGENAGKKNCGKGGAEHGEILSVDGSKPTEADAPSL